MHNWPSLSKTSTPYTMNKLFILLLTIATIAVSSCGGNDDDGTTNENCVVAYSNDLSEAADDILTALNAFTSDQSTANCEAYLQTLREYLNVVERYENCAGLNQTDFQMELESARESIDDAEDCN